MDAHEHLIVPTTGLVDLAELEHVGGPYCSWTIAFIVVPSWHPSDQLPLRGVAIAAVSIYAVRNSVRCKSVKAYVRRKLVSRCQAN